MSTRNASEAQRQGTINLVSILAMLNLEQECTSWLRRLSHRAGEWRRGSPRVSESRGARRCPHGGCPWSQAAMLSRPAPTAAFSGAVVGTSLLAGAAFEAWVDSGASTRRGRRRRFATAQRNSRDRRALDRFPDPHHARLGSDGGCRATAGADILLDPCTGDSSAQTHSTLVCAWQNLLRELSP